jgi:hypothetical protein
MSWEILREITILVLNTEDLELGSLQRNNIDDHAKMNRVRSRPLVEQGTNLPCQLKFVIKALSWRHAGITQIANLLVVAGGYAR